MVGGGCWPAPRSWWCRSLPNLIVLIVALCVFGVAAAFLGTAPAAAVGDAAGGRSGTAVAVFSMCSDLGAIVGPVVAGLLADRFSYGVAFGVSAGLALAAALYALRMPRGLPEWTPTREEVENTDRAPVD